MSRHSYIRMTKLNDVCGRIDYISNPKRQEYLYATFSTVKPEFWDLMSAQSQMDFWKSNQKGVCTEARELVIALPGSFQETDAEEILKKFVEKFRSEYGMQCTAALHHNKTKNNLHIHMIFSDRELLEKPEEKIATRNMFYDENGRHVRTKKEILDEEGNIREGCRVIKKGNPYEIRFFGPRKEEFKSRKILPEVKHMYTDLINELVPDKNEKQKVFDPKGPYLPTKKIGKNNPLEEEIRYDNALREKWNDAIDQVLIAGGTIEEVTEYKTKVVTDRIAESVQEHGYQPGLFAELLVKAIEVLIEFLEFLMGKQNQTEREMPEEEQPVIKAETAGPADKRKPTENMEKFANAKIQYMNAKKLHDDLSKTNKKIYAVTKTIEKLEAQLKEIPQNMFNRKDRRALEVRIESEKEKLDKAKAHLQMLPKMKGYASVKEAEAVYRKAAGVYHTLQRKAEGKPRPKTKKPVERESVLLHLAEVKKLLNEQEYKPKSDKKVRAQER